MAVYIVTPLTISSAALNKAVEDTIVLQGDKYKLQSDRGWLISFGGTTVELSDHIGLTGQPVGEVSPIGSAIVVPVTAYYGRGPADMWEWLKTRLEK